MAAGRKQEAVPKIVLDNKIYSDYTDSKDEMLQQFISRQEDLRGEVFTCESVEKMASILVDILKDFGLSAGHRQGSDVNSPRRSRRNHYMMP